MTVEELIEKLLKEPKDKKVFVYQGRRTGFLESPHIDEIYAKLTSRELMSIEDYGEPVIVIG